MRIFAVTTHQRGEELINLSKRMFTGKTTFVADRIEKSFTASFSHFAITFVFSNVGNDLVAEAHFTGIKDVESVICIEVGSCNQ